MLGLLSQKFFSWFKTRKEKVILLYGLSSSMLALNAFLTIAYVDLDRRITSLHKSTSGASILSFYCTGFCGRYPVLWVCCLLDSVIYVDLECHGFTFTLPFTKIGKSEILDNSQPSLGLFFDPISAFVL